MSQGKIIEFIDQGRIVCTLCLQDKGNRLHLLTSLNRQINIAPKRALLISTSSINSLKPREELLGMLKHAEGIREGLKEEIRVKDLWELIREERESFDYRYLAQLCFGEEVTDDHISALVRALFEDRLYFKIKDGLFLPHSEAMVEKIIRQREEEARKEKRLREGSTWLKDVLGQETVQVPSDRKDVIDTLIELALYGKDASCFKYGKELLLLAGISDIQEARKTLIKLKVWDEDEALDLLRFGIRNSFSDEQLHESERLNNIEIERAGREDLTDLACFTIDGPLTMDFDDALNFEIQGDYILVGIHIADVADVIAKDSCLDREAALRGSSLYLPRRQIPMIPFNLSHDALSLKQGADRPAISLLTRFDRNGNLYDYRFVPSVINVREQLTYDQVNEERMQEKLFVQAHRLCEQLLQKRVEQGALILSLPDVSVNIDDESSISLKMLSQETPARMIVAEFMILYNWLAARFCRDNNVPLLFRSQKEPGDRLTVEETGYTYYVFKQRRKLLPLVIDTKPGPHSGLGLDPYSNLSSPIRRYFDLVSQHQIKSFLFKGVPLYNKDELEKIRLSVMPPLKDLNIIKRNRTRYWILKYYLQHLGEAFPAIVLNVMKGRYRIVLTDSLFVAELKREAGHDFSQGDRIMVRVRKSDPWGNMLKLEEAGKIED